VTQLALVAHHRPLAATQELSYSTTALISDAHIWWRLCVRLLSRTRSKKANTNNGDERLAHAALNIISIISEAKMTNLPTAIWHGARNAVKTARALPERHT
jgi:hypothetical protein